MILADALKIRFLAALLMRGTRLSRATTQHGMLRARVRGLAGGLLQAGLTARLTGMYTPSAR